jgi:hypothetical protein
LSVFEQVRQITALEAAERLGLKLKKNGSKHWACCPLHGEKTASLCIYDEGTWYCFGCHKGGDAVRLYQEMFGMDAKDAALRLAEDFGIRVDDHWTPPKERKPTAFDLERALEARRSAEWSKLCSAVHRANAILGKYDAHPESAWDSKEFITALQARTAANERLDWLWSATLADLALEYREEKQCERRRAPSAGGADGGRPGDSGAGGDGAQTPAAGSPCAAGCTSAAGAASIHAASAGTAEAGVLLGGEPVRTHH